MLLSQNLEKLAAFEPNGAGTFAEDSIEQENYEL